MISKGWQLATVTAIQRETGDVKSFTLQPESPLSTIIPARHNVPFIAGQHIDVRLTAPDGYQAQRSYSIASAPEQAGTIDITVELLADGEVSPYFHYVLEPGDQIEFRGPIGGPFTWQAQKEKSILLVGGGAGVVPLISMLRHRAASGIADSIPAVLLYSSRTANHIIYRQELDDMDAADDKLSVLHTLTRHQPPGWTGRRRRIDIELMQDALSCLGDLAENPDTEIDCYICGPSDLVESVARFAVDIGISPENVRTERFGPTGT